MKLIATDTLNITAVKRENIEAGEAFEIEDGQAKELVKRGLATEAQPEPAPKPAKGK